jgi:hypothetical protein
MRSIVLNDWMTKPEMRIGTQITGDAQNTVYHSHDFFEIFYCVEGFATHLVNNASETVQTGDIVLLRPTDTHMFKRARGQVLIHRDIVIDARQFKESCDYIAPALFARLTAPRTPFKYRESKSCGRRIFGFTVCRRRFRSNAFGRGMPIGFAAPHIKYPYNRERPCAARKAHALSLRRGGSRPKIRRSIRLSCPRRRRHP